MGLDKLWLMGRVHAMGSAVLSPPAGATILALGRAPHADGIRQTTGGNYSHATLWTGDAVIEATLPGVRRVGLDQLNATSLYVDAFRHKRLGAEGVAVVRAGEAYLARPYDRVDLLLASAVSALSVWPDNRWLRYNSSHIIGRARRLLERLSAMCIYRSEEALTCVELVALAHRDAGLPIVVRLDPSGRFDFRLLWEALRSLQRADRLASGDGRESNGQPSFIGAEDGTDSLQAELAWAFGIQRAFPEDLEASVADLQQLRLVVGEDWPAAFVTPAQLERSESFELVTRLFDGEV